MIRNPITYNDIHLKTLIRIWNNKKFLFMHDINDIFYSWKKVNLYQSDDLLVVSIKGVVKTFQQNKIVFPNDENWVSGFVKLLKNYLTIELYILIELRSFATECSWNKTSCELMKQISKMTWGIILKPFLKCFTSSVSLLASSPLLPSYSSFHTYIWGRKSHY